MLIVDASVAAKWIFNEPDSRAALNVLGSSTPIVAPELIIAEVCNVAWKRLTAGAITVDQAALTPRALRSLIDDLVSMVGLGSRSLEMARELGHPVYDCFYLALAEARGARLMTADRKLVRVVKHTAWEEIVEQLA